jgi:hypothetical protein
MARYKNSPGRASDLKPHRRAGAPNYSERASASARLQSRLSRNDPLISRNEAHQWMSEIMISSGANGADPLAIIRLRDRSSQRW